jgi:protease I
MRLENKTIAMLLGPGFEELEHWVVYMRMVEEGASVWLVGAKANERHHGKSGALPATTDTAAADVRINSIDALLVPGGYAPDKMRRDEHMVRLVREMFEAGKPLGLICHAGSMAISAGIIRPNVRATGSLGIRDDLVAAGATWVDEPAFRDGCVVWGRHVNDLPDYCRLLVETIDSSG